MRTDLKEGLPRYVAAWRKACGGKVPSIGLSAGVRPGHNFNQSEIDAGRACLEQLATGELVPKPVRECLAALHTLAMETRGSIGSFDEAAQVAASTYLHYERAVRPWLGDGDETED